MLFNRQVNFFLFKGEKWLCVCVHKHASICRYLNCLIPNKTTGPSGSLKTHMPHLSGVSGYGCPACHSWTGDVEDWNPNLDWALSPLKSGIVWQVIWWTHFVLKCQQVAILTHKSKQEKVLKYFQFERRTFAGMGKRQGFLYSNKPGVELSSDQKKMNLAFDSILNCRHQGQKLATHPESNVEWCWLLLAGTAAFHILSSADIGRKEVTKCLTGSFVQCMINPGGRWFAGNPGDGSTCIPRGATFKLN